MLFIIKRFINLNIFKFHVAQKNRASIIFTEKEMEIIKQRLAGDYSDPTGVFSRRIRPKLKEIHAWLTPSMRRQLRKILKQKRKTERAVSEEPVRRREMDFDKFKKKFGY